MATIMFGMSTSFALSLAALFVLGAADNISVVIRQTVLQLLTPDSMRGRVTAVSVIFIGSSNELGEFESGVAASLLGLVPSVVFGGVMTLVTVGVVAVMWPELVRLGSLEHLEPPDPAEACERGSHACAGSLQMLGNPSARAANGAIMLATRVPTRRDLVDEMQSMRRGGAGESRVLSAMRRAIGRRQSRRLRRMQAGGAGRRGRPRRARSKSCGPARTRRRR